METTLNTDHQVGYVSANASYNALENNSQNFNLLGVGGQACLRVHLKPYNLRIDAYASRTVKTGREQEFYLTDHNWSNRRELQSSLPVLEQGLNYLLLTEDGAAVAVLNFREEIPERRWFRISPELEVFRSEKGLSLRHADSKIIRNGVL